MIVSKNVKLQVLCAALTGFFLMTTAAHGAQYVSVSKDGVNMRSGPDTKQEILWEVFKGFPLKVLELKGKWVHVVDFEGDKGWIYSPLLSKKKTVIVTANVVNMRVGPGKDYEIMASVKYGVVFTPIDREGDWVQVKHEDGTSGWIYKKLLWP
jgi:SH3-like domain-containing protein